MKSIVNLLQELASLKPMSNNAEINKLLNLYTDEVKQAILCHDNQALKNLISSNHSYAHETKVTIY